MSSPSSGESGWCWPPDSRAVAHVDMDAFFASAEVRRRPELRGRPVVVGGTGDRGVVAAATYEARAFGIHSAMPTARARRLCPHAVFLQGDHRYYAEVSSRIMAIFAEVTPSVEPLSLDEAFLELTGVRRLSGDPVEVASRIRQRVLDAEGLTCSVGVAPNKFLAKLGSESAKPRADSTGVRHTGVFVIRPGDEHAFLDPLPVERLWGVGPATLGRLQRIGVLTVADLRRMGRPRLTAALGTSAGERLVDLAEGRDERPVVTGAGARSISQEETFALDRHGVAELLEPLVGQADTVAGRLRHQGLVARTVTLKVRFSDFETVTRSETLTAPTNDGLVVAATAERLLRRMDPARPVRLLGVGVTGLGAPGPTQLRLPLEGDPAAPGHPPGKEGAVHVNEVVDAIRERWGSGAIRPARTAARPGGAAAEPWGKPAGSR